MMVFQDQYPYDSNQNRFANNLKVDLKPPFSDKNEDQGVDEK
jgi:hypothetical protein